MSLNFYGATGLTGGTDGMLDDIDGAALVDGDGAVVITAGHTFIYHLDADSAAAESSPNVIEPDANGGDKRWILNDVLGGGEVIQLFPHNITAEIQGTWVTSTNASYRFGYIIINNSASADGDELNFKAYMAKGIYTLSFAAARNTYCGIADFYIDAIEVASIDMYGALVYANLWQEQNIVVATSGIKTIRIVVDGKHVSSSDYNCLFSCLSFHRTA